MTTSYTSLLGLALPATGELNGTWGATVNNSITSLLDSAVAGTTTLSTDANVTLTTTELAANEARQPVLLCTGARTVLRTITAPARSKTYVVINATTGGFGVKVVGAGPTTGVTIENGRKALIAWNGSDFVVVASTLINVASDVTGILAIGNGGTGTSNAPNFNSVIVSNNTGTAYSSLAQGTTGELLKGRYANTPIWGQASLTTDVSGILPAANGGTGVNNSNTITLGGDLATSGASGLTLTTTATTNVTLPTSGTLVANGSSPVFTNLGVNTALSINNLGVLRLYNAGNADAVGLLYAFGALSIDKPFYTTSYITAAAQPSFTASLSTTQSNVIGFSSAPYLVPFDTVMFVRGSSYSGGSSFTAPVTGIYRFSMSIQLIVAGATRISGALLTSAKAYNFDVQQSASFAASQTVSGSVLVPMTQGDTAAVSVTANGMGSTTGSVLGGGSYLNTYFSGELVC